MKSFKKLLDTARQRDRYWVETAKLNFSVELNRLFKRSGMTQAELAAKIGSSPAYITKVFRGDTNFTIETMVKLAAAVDGELRIEIVSKTANAHWLQKLASTHIEQAVIDETAQQWVQLTRKHHETDSSLA